MLVAKCITRLLGVYGHSQQSFSYFVTIKLLWQLKQGQL